MIYFVSSSSIDVFNSFFYYIIKSDGELKTHTYIIERFPLKFFKESAGASSGIYYIYYRARVNFET